MYEYEGALGIAVYSLLKRSLLLDFYTSLIFSLIPTIQIFVTFDISCSLTYMQREKQEN